MSIPHDKEFPHPFDSFLHFDKKLKCHINLVEKDSFYEYLLTNFDKDIFDDEAFLTNQKQSFLQNQQKK